jgi:hypothetical protein
MSSIKKLVAQPLHVGLSSLGLSVKRVGFLTHSTETHESPTNSVGMAA